MSDTDDIEDAPAKKKKGLLMPLILGLVLAGAGGAGSYLFMTGAFSGGGDEAHGEDHAGDGEAAPDYDPLAPLSFVALDPLVINLPPGSDKDYLTFRATLEVRPEALGEVETLKPRIADVLNTYLRALDMAELEDPTILTRIRGQLLRRVELVTGADRVRDILVAEFILN